MTIVKLNAPEVAPEKFARGLFVTDFDGTLRTDQGGYSDNDLEALERIKEFGFIRAIATGRNLYSFNKAVSVKLPVDYLIFSSGSGVIRMEDGFLELEIHFEAPEVEYAAERLKEHKLDFMIHNPVPDNHAFLYHANNTANTDFFSRIAIYKDFALSMEKSDGRYGPASQLLAVVPGDAGPDVYYRIKEILEGYNVVRTTSPLDGDSVWIEIFPSDASKGLASEWLAGRFGVKRSETIGIGNDYNDIDLLQWAAAGYVVANAPEELRRRFTTVPSNNNGGVAAAINRRLSMHGHLS